MKSPALGPVVANMADVPRAPAPMKPITGIAFCCARAASDQAAAVPKNHAPPVFGYVADALEGGRAPITSMWSKQFYETDPSRDFVCGTAPGRDFCQGPVTFTTRSLVPPL